MKANWPSERCNKLQGLGFRIDGLWASFRYSAKDRCPNLLKIVWMHSHFANVSYVFDPMRQHVSAEQLARWFRVRIYTYLDCPTPTPTVVLGSGVVAETRPWRRYVHRKERNLSGCHPRSEQWIPVRRQPCDPGAGISLHGGFLTSPRQISFQRNAGGEDNLIHFSSSFA